MCDNKRFGNSEQLNDLISRQAAIDAIDRLDIPEDMCVFEILSHIELEIGNLPSAQQWISCSERLPEKPGQYYVSGGDKVWICEFLIIATTNIPNFIGGWCNDVANPVVQAWMPIPEPYREDTP